MVSFSNIITLVEIMAAGLIFLYSFPKRKPFWLRLGLSALAAVTVAAFVPEGIETEVMFLSRFYVFFRYMLLFALSVGVMCLSFEAPFPAVLCASSAGYAVQHIASRVTVLLIRTTPVRKVLTMPYPWYVFICEAAVFPVIYLAVFLTLGRLTAKNRLFSRYNRAMNILSLAMVIVCIGISRFDQAYAVLIYPIAMGLFALMVQISLNRSVSLREENAVMHRVIAENSRRYEVSKESMDLLNMKLHDLKYRLSALGEDLSSEEADLVSKAIGIYDRKVETGNEVLDVILAENVIRCDSMDITLTWMGNFAALDFMDTVDMYIFFGNALDNAVEAVRRIEEKEKRQISITAEKRGDPVIVTFTNFYTGDILPTDDGFRTTKKKDPDSHGFGIKSMRMIAQRYGGDITVSYDGELFSLSAYLHAPE